MMKQLAYMFAVLSLTLAGCSGSICEDYRDAEEELEEKAAPCNDGYTGGTGDEFNVLQCESDCSASDKEAIEEYIRCAGAVEKCVKGKEEVYGGAVLDCRFAAASKLSDACTTVITQNIRRSVADYSVSR